VTQELFSAPAVPRRGAAPEPEDRDPKRARRASSLQARGEPFVWLLAAGQIAACAMIVGLLSLILVQGVVTFWPKDLTLVSLHSGQRLLGEVTRSESFRPLPAHDAPDAPLAAAGRRQLLRTGNYDLYGDDFRWVTLTDVVTREHPPEAVTLERMSWGPFFGFIEEFRLDGVAATKGRSEAWERFTREHGAAVAVAEAIKELEKGRIGEINDEMEANRLAARRTELAFGKDSPEFRAEAARLAAAGELLDAEYAKIQEQVSRLRAEADRRTILVSEVGGATKELKAAEIVRAFLPNDLSVLGKARVYLARWWEFLTAEPREANTEGGVWPAIFGTVIMTLIMAVAVAPFGVMAALYLREYARQGLVVSAVRIAVNNLAGVPSIVFGVFGLGFFCYIVGGTIDEVFFSEKLPTPTFGTGGLMWASLTLALMTLPVVIVATEEALSAVPRSMREGAYACGASKWQVIRRIVLPKAMPGIMTGILLAMARGAGEVAPLMITGVVKLAPELPVDGHFPFVHLNRSFMHLGFHIYDAGFQSRNSEAGKPMVYTTALLLICVIVLLNLTVISVRGRLKRKYAVGYF
jgi:phosphate transport system permease protein